MTKIRACQRPEEDQLGTSQPRPLACLCCALAPSYIKWWELRLDMGTNGALPENCFWVGPPWNSMFAVCDFPLGYSARKLPWIEWALTSPSGEWMISSEYRWVNPHSLLCEWPLVLGTLEWEVCPSTSTFWFFFLKEYSLKLGNSLCGHVFPPDIWTCI